MVLRLLRGAGRGVAESRFVEIEEVPASSVVTAGTLSRDRTGRPRICHGCPLVPLMDRGRRSHCPVLQPLRRSRRSRRHESGGSPSPTLSATLRRKPLPRTPRSHLLAHREGVPHTATQPRSRNPRPMLPAAHPRRRPPLQCRLPRPRCPQQARRRRTSRHPPRTTLPWRGARIPKSLRRILDRATKATPNRPDRRERNRCPLRIPNDLHDPHRPLHRRPRHLPATMDQRIQPAENRMWIRRRSRRRSGRPPSHPNQPQHHPQPSPRTLRLERLPASLRTRRNPQPRRRHQTLKTVPSPAARTASDNQSEVPKFTAQQAWLPGTGTPPTRDAALSTQN